MNKIKAKITLTLLLISLFFISKLNAETLPPHLVEWAHNNPVVKVGVDGAFPPFDYVNEHGNTAGAGKLIRQKLSEILPLDLKETSFALIENYSLLFFVTVFPSITTTISPLGGFCS